MKTIIALLLFTSFDQGHWIHDPELYAREYKKCLAMYKDQSQEVKDYCINKAEQLSRITFRSEEGQQDVEHKGVQQ